MIKELKQQKIKSKFAYDIASLIYYHILIRQRSGKGKKLLINSFPKSGTHLLTNLLTYIPEYKFSGVHIKTYKVNALASRAEENNIFKPDSKKIESYFKLVKPGQYISAHLPYDKEVVSQSVINNISVLALIRDPRDIVVSEANYIMGLKRHYFHKYLGRNLSLDDVVKLLLDGFEYGPSYIYLPLKVRVDGYKGWLDDKRVCSFKYEDLLPSEKGGNDDLAIKSIESFLELIGRNDVNAEILLEKAKGKPSATLRKGGKGNWKLELKKSTIDYMEKNLEKSLCQLGYI